MNTIGKRMAMVHKSKCFVFICGVIGNLLYLWGIYRFAVSEGTETDFFINAVVMAVSMGLLIYHGETNANAINKNRLWGLSGLFGPLGWGLLYFFARSTDENIYAVSAQTERISTSTFGMMAAVVILICWLCAVLWLLTDLPSESKIIAKRTVANERNAYLNMGNIAEAQDTYQRTDWDSDGKKTFAQFLPHLWVTVDGRAMSVQTGLLPKKLAFAIDEKNSLNGYYYTNTIDCKDMMRPTEPENRASFSLPSNEYDTCFSAMAIPAVSGEAGRLAFRINETGSVYALVVNKETIPSDSLQAVPPGKWVKVQNIEDVEALQRKIRK